MNKNLLQKLTAWRDQQAQKEGIESFRVLPYKPLEEIARVMPTSKEELIQIKGIKEKKWQSYGKEILSIVNSEGQEVEPNIANKSTPPTPPIRVDEHVSPPMAIGGVGGLNEKSANVEFQLKDKVISVGDFLDYINEKLRVEQARVKGEISSVDKRDKAVYFKLKDSKDESVLNCLIWRNQYNILGVELEIGQEVIVDGFPEIYKQQGRFSLKASAIELVGEGVLKKCYDKLKKKLEAEGLFAPEGKKPLPELPYTVGLITSDQGAAIGDFTANLGKFGFKIKFINSSVEGNRAVFELISAVKQFNEMPNIDVLAIVRGGGSLESLQAFNNEALVREVVNCKMPVVCGVGHERDVSLVALTADVAVSTPTAAAKVIGESWEKAIQALQNHSNNIVNSYSMIVIDKKRQLEKLAEFLTKKLTDIFDKFRAARQNFSRGLMNFQHALQNKKTETDNFKKIFLDKFKQTLIEVKNKINHLQKLLGVNNPERQLRLGYSIVSLKGKVVRSVKQVSKHDQLDIKMSDGEIGAVVNKKDETRN